eukprot:TRINITY_DN27566_c0_g1_i1.p2 TRINITY_DN27566_c0_g1~~TRINITY_DN27566_c0_g1_i1.p2  ORF type:complete len:69 (-),score=0.06 TRINITY_DN27566_c0_g1_i1:89-295(-)
MLYKILDIGSISRNLDNASGTFPPLKDSHPLCHLRIVAFNMPSSNAINATSQTGQNKQPCRFRARCVV